jgi:HAE1 family hydrophobic/amphiphilic exporter-1
VIESLALRLMRNPVGVFMTALTVAVLGLLAFRGMPASYYPKFTAPVLVVQTVLPGASAEDVEEQVTEPLEDALSGLGNVEKIESVSREGLSLTFISFGWGVDLAQAKLDVNERVVTARGRLPREALNPSVRDVQSFLAPAVELGLSSPRLSLDELRDLAEDVLADRVRQLGQVGSVVVVGGAPRVLRVVADRARLESVGMTLAEVRLALQTENLDVPVGTVTQGPRAVSVRVEGSARRLEDVRDLVVAVRNGSPVSLGQVAQVQPSRDELRSVARVDGQDAVTLRVYDKADGNTVELVADVRRLVPDLRRLLPPEVALEVVGDESRPITAALRSVYLGAAIGSVLAILVLLLFLRSVSNTLVVALSIPLSLVASFGLMRGFGLTVNTISLGGLALGVGMVVDASIVVLENIHRHLARAGGGHSLIAAATGEVGGAVFASTLTSVVVFLPMAFLKGLAAVLLGELALTVVFCLTTSIIVSLTVIPTLARALSAAQPAKTSENGTLSRVQAAYRTTLGWALNNRAVFLVVVVLLLGGGASLGGRLDVQMLPNPNAGQFTAEVEMPVGTSLGETRRVVVALEEGLRARPAVTRVRTAVGTVGALAEERPEAGEVTVDVQLKALGGPGALAALMDAVRGEAAALAPAARVVVRQKDQAEGSKKPGLQVRVLGPDLETLRVLGEQVREVVAKVEGTRDVSSTLGARRPVIRVRMDRPVAARRGVGTAQAMDALNATVAARKVSSMRFEGRSRDVLLGLAAEGGRASELAQLPLLSPSGVGVPLGEVADVRYADGPAEIRRVGRSRAAEVRGEIVGRKKALVRAEVDAAVAGRLKLPPGYRLEWEGESRSIVESFQSLGVALLLGLFLVFAVMAAQFNSLRKPLVIMMTVPSAAVGAVVALWLGGSSLNINGMLGMLMLIGIAVNNGILLVEFVDGRLAEGARLRDALLDAGEARLRPIMMTSMTTIFGMFPLALGLGEGSEALVPLGLSVLGGLVLSTFLTLWVVPVVFSLVAPRRSVSLPA